MRIFLGLIGCVLSIIIVVYRDKIIHFMGPIGWAERHLGGGGTYTLFVLMGIFFFFFSLMYMTDSFSLIFGGKGVDFFESVK